MTEAPKEFARGLESGQFVPCFQPVVWLRSGEVADFEVLARWQHPQVGSIPPDTFVPMAEAGGWIGELMAVLARQAFQAATALPYNIRLSLNASTVQLRDDSLPGLLERLASQAGFPLEQVSIEIAEKALCSDAAQVQAIARRLKALGCGIDLDDFSGEASLRHIESLPLDALKLDRTFVQSMTVQRESRRMVEAALAIGQSLRLRTVAKGVQTQEQAEMLFSMGCDLGQGWLYGEPVALDRLAEFTQQRTPAPATGDRSWMTTLLPASMSAGKRLAQLQAIYDGAPVGLGFMDRQLRLVRVNHRFAEMSGITVEEAVGHTLAEVLPELYSLVEPSVKRVLAGESVSDAEIAESRDAEGGGRVFRVFLEPARDEAGGIAAVSFALIDITARNRAE